MEWAREDWFHHHGHFLPAVDLTPVGPRHTKINDDKDEVDPWRNELKRLLIDSFTERIMVNKKDKQ